MRRFDSHLLAQVLRAFMERNNCSAILRTIQWASSEHQSIWRIQANEATENRWQHPIQTSIASLPTWRLPFPARLQAQMANWADKTPNWADNEHDLCGVCFECLSWIFIISVIFCLCSSMLSTKLPKRPKRPKRPRPKVGSGHSKGRHPVQPRALELHAKAQGPSSLANTGSRWEAALYWKASTLSCQQMSWHVVSPCFVKFSNNVPQARTQTMQIRSGRRQRLKEYDNYMASKSCRLFYEELWHCGSREAERPPCHTSAQSVCWKHGSLSALSCRPSAIASLLCRLGWKKNSIWKKGLVYNLHTTLRHLFLCYLLTFWARFWRRTSHEDATMNTAMQANCSQNVKTNLGRTYENIVYTAKDKICWIRKHRNTSKKTRQTNKPESSHMKHLCETNYANSFVHDSCATVQL